MKNSKSIFTSQFVLASLLTTLNTTQVNAEFVYELENNPSAERCALLQSIFAEGDWTARYGSTAELVNCKDSYSTAELRSKPTLAPIVPIFSNNLNQEIITLDAGTKQTILLNATSQTNSNSDLNWNPQLMGIDSDKLQCQKLVTTASNQITDQWECTALKPDFLGREIFIQNTNQYGQTADSQSIIIKIKNSLMIPAFSDTNLETLEGISAQNLYEQGIISGFPDGEFKGDNAVNRAEITKFLLLAKNIDPQNTDQENIYSDVQTDQWFSDYVLEATKQGIVKGYEDGSFKPANTVNTAEFLKMLAITFDAPLNADHKYNDVPDSVWYSPYVGIASKYNLFPERNTNNLEPEKLLTRSEVAIAINQMLDQ